MLDGAIALAKKYKISPLVIGSTIVAFGSILPSIAINIAILLLDPENLTIAIGNMLGTNYVNLGLALGIPAFMTDIVTKYVVFEKEIPLYLGLMALLTAFAVNYDISRYEGVLMLLAYVMVALIIFQYATREKVNKDDSSQMEIESQIKVSLKKSILLIVTGLLTLIGASFLLTYSAPLLASALGIDPYIIGLTLVGIGTSLPTIVASIQAAKKGYIDIILGNVFGGNIINIGLGVGLPAVFHNLKLDQNAVDDIYFTNMYNFIIVIAILIEMKLLGGNKSISRISGIIIITIYVGYILTRIL